MHSFGIDIHKSFYQVADLIDGQSTQMRIETGKTGEQLLLEHISQCGPCTVTMEACTGALHLHALIEKNCTEAKQYIVDGRKFRQRFPKAGRKTDKVDAYNLALLGTYNNVESIWIPTEEVRRQRKTTAHRVHLVSQQTEERNRIHGALREHGIKLPFKTGTLWSSNGRKWLASRCDSLYRELSQEIKWGMERLDVLERQISEIDRQIAEWAVHSPNAQLLITVPGIAAFAAQAALAELGDPFRFSNARQVTRIAGLDPSVSQTGLKGVLGGGISKRGRSMLRWIMVECAFSSVRCCPRFKAFYDRVYRRTRSGSKAKVATARKLLTICWHVLVSGRPFNDEQPKLTESKRKRIKQAAARTGSKRERQCRPPEWLETAV